MIGDVTADPGPPSCGRRQKEGFNEEGGGAPRQGFY